MLVPMASLHSSLWLNTLPLCVCVCVCVCVCKYHIFINCFHILTIVNDADMNTGVNVSFLISVVWLVLFLDIYPGVGFLCCMVVPL